MRFLSHRRWHLLRSHLQDWGCDVFVKRKLKRQAEAIASEVDAAYHRNADNSVMVVHIAQQYQLFIYAIDRHALEGRDVSRSIALQTQSYESFAAAMGWMSEEVALAVAALCNTPPEARRLLKLQASFLQLLRAL